MDTRTIGGEAGGGASGEGEAGVPVFGPADARLQLPNALTVARLFMAAAFVAVLSVYEVGAGPAWAVWAGAALFVAAALTDALDGYLARRWGAISVFGRVMDPLADKLLVLSAFIVLAGPSFAVGADVPAGVWFGQASGVYPWMAAAILARELLVTSLRGVCEGRGIDFSAGAAGKLKMIAQSVAVPVVLVGVGAAASAGGALPAWSAAVFNANFVIGMLVTGVTVWSAVPYVRRAVAGLREAEGGVR
jgi:CDP-diacylglycerol--glycerol-3-phosphate 3-phosphatidyltransferase